MSDQLLKLIASLGPDKRATLAELLRPPAEPIAIVGLACRYPRASSADGLWRVLREGTEAITPVPPERWDAQAYLERDPALAPTTWGGFLDDVALFDAAAFGISPREAVQIDPQQRLLLEVVWEALEDAGLPLDRVAGSQAGVFVGACGGGEYASICLRDQQALGPHSGPGVSNNMLSGRISFAFDLRGPSLTIDTACSASLVAVHAACASLRRKECAVAIAGGVNLVLLPELMMMMHGMRLLAADGRCKVFDARADGMVRAEGCGAVVLKRLSDARADGDRVWGLVRGSAVNQNGRANGVTAPNGAAQREVIEAALREAGVAPGDVSFVETHGTGTPIGDSIEVEALKDVLGQGRDAARPCRLGAVKANLGHSEGAAGILGVIKVALTFANQAIPRQINFRRPSPLIALEGTPFSIPTEEVRWTRGERPRLAGVSAFGWSGTNAHAVLEEPPLGEAASADPGSLLGPWLVPISARTPRALRGLVQRWSAFAQELEAADVSAADLADLAYSAARRRAHHPLRRAVVAGTPAELRSALEALPDVEAGEAAPASQPGRGGVVLVVPDGGCAGASALVSRLRSEPAFREVVEACAAAFAPFTRSSLVEPPGLERPGPEIDGEGPVCFTMRVALAALWRSWGIQPAAVVGQGRGEVAAAVIAGVLRLEEGARLVAEGSRLGEGALRPQAPVIPLFTASAGGAASIEEGTLALPAWIERLERPSPIDGMLDALVGEGRDVFLELSAEPVLAPAIREILGRAARPGLVLASGRRQEEPRAVMLGGLALLYAAGHSIDWARLFPAPRRVVRLPSYAWDHQRYWPAQLDTAAAPDLARLAGALRGVPSLLDELRSLPAEQHRGRLELRLRSEFAGFLQIAPHEIDPDKSLVEYGFTSIMAIEVRNWLSGAVGGALPLDRLFGSLTLTSVTDAVLEQAQAAIAGVSGPAPPPPAGAPGSAVDLLRETQRADHLVPAAPGWRPTAAPRRVFLTGASGFLGAFLLRDLVVHGGVEVCCLVRAANPEEGWQRLRAGLESYGLWDDALAGRIVPVCGDLMLPRFGLGEGQFTALAEQVDGVYHSGAVVNLVLPYRSLEGTNVAGTEEAIRLACAGRPKPLHHVSTAATLHTAGNEERLLAESEDALGDGGGLLNGYAQTKWVAERLLWRAAARGLPVTIHRPGHIGPDARSGRFSVNDAFARLLLNCVQLGEVPDVARLDMSPVDYVSRAIVELSLAGSSLGRVFHLMHPQPVPMATIAQWLTGMGFPVRVIEMASWMEKIVAAAEREDNALHALRALLRPERLVRWPHFDTVDTVAALEARGVRCPPVDPEMFRTILTCFERAGMLSAVPGAASRVRARA